MANTQKDYNRNKKRQLVTPLRTHSYTILNINMKVDEVENRFVLLWVNLFML